MTGQAPGFATRVVRWQASHGRNGLPWQNTRDPYRVWLSEIMLQQTQVTTVLDYYPRFLARFPDVQSLASATEDEVLALWSGLGYYSRARNLHRCARVVMDVHQGAFPQTADQLVTLPGIGRSTAAAIAAFCHGERVAILDANVQRVLTRVLGFEGDLAQAAWLRQLWDAASSMLPRRDVARAMPRYTQGLMDLGAMLCTPRRPQCTQCPVQSLCEAHAQGRPEAFPVKTRKLQRSSAVLWLLWARRDDGALWLVRRPPTGIWAGLFCLPVFDSESQLLQGLPAASCDAVQMLAPRVHALTHRDLHLHPVQVQLPQASDPPGAGRWYSLSEALALGLPAPVRKLLQTEG